MSVIEVSHLTKEYRLGALQSFKQTLLNAGARLIGKRLAERPLFKALDDVTFSIEQGEVVGIIGHNGAGKSTLLKMLARISTPTFGSVKVNGRIAPLIEVGAGFVPDFTGRENVYLNGAILGMSKKEIDQKFDEIVDFAEMAEFIDTPIKRYSSGMQVKLAFALATSIESEILIVDEVLAVGDLAFQRKCFNRMRQLIQSEGTTVLIVGHNIRQLEQICGRMLLLEHGKLLMDGSPAVVCNSFYQTSGKKAHSVSTGTTQRNNEISSLINNLAITFRDDNGHATQHLQYGKCYSIVIHFHLMTPLPNAAFFLGVHTVDFVNVSANETYATPIDLAPGLHELFFRIHTLTLLPGSYAMRLWLGTRDGQAMVNAYGVATFDVFSPDFGITRMQDAGFFQLVGHWEHVGRIVGQIPDSAKPPVKTMTGHDSLI